jgi:ABC-type glutathione transport system ATPase component
MPLVDCVKTTPVSSSFRARQVQALFDVPEGTEQTKQWRGDVPIESFDWNVGLIVGPSGCGKSSVAKQLFGEFEKPFDWGGAAVVDDFDRKFSVQQITETLSAVGFGTIPAWLRPYGVLSNGEKFRAETARRILENSDLCVVDEFTSVVDRQVAQVASHAIQKTIRARKQKFVAVSCHYDIVE